MKSRSKKRILALVLCMVVALSNSSFIFASETGDVEYPTEAYTAEAEVQPQAIAETGEIEAVPQGGEEQPVTSEPTAEPTVESTPEVTPEATPQATPEITPEPTPEAAPEVTPDAPVTQPTEPQQNGTPVVTEEGQLPQITEPMKNQALQLKHQFTNELGEVTETVVAEVPEGAFEVKEDSVIEMKVSLLTEEQAQRLEALMEKEPLPEGKELDSYIAYDIRFLVDGIETEAAEAIKITLTGDDTAIEVTEDAKVFYLDPKDPEVINDQEELVEIQQKADVIKALQEAGQSIENLDETYDLSEITLKEDAIVEKIELEARKSTIYGCYTEVIAQEEEEIVDDETMDLPVAESPTQTETDTYAGKATSNSGVTLEASYGKLTASFSGSGISYVWYRSINGGEWELQKPTTYTNPSGTSLGSDIKADGTELYIALNGGALGYKNGSVMNTSVKYQVKVYNTSDLENGVPKSGTTARGTSDEYNVTSYYELQNGSFETPVIESYMSQVSNSDYKDNGGVWQTTGTGGWNHYNEDIEIIRPEKSTSSFKNSYSWNGDVIVPDGKQFVELNCEASGSLYQDVLTTPGETLNYQLSHRARGKHQNSTSETDTMYVVIMSTELAVDNAITTQAKVREVINNKEDYPGAAVATYSSTDQAWSVHQGSYTVTAANQYSTRFFFVAGDTASGNETIGNFLDNVKFTRNKLTPVAGTANVTIERTISGLPTLAEAETLAKGLTFHIGTKEYHYDDLTWTWADGIYKGSKTISLPETECGSKEVSEIGNLDVSGYTRSSSVFVNGSILATGTSGTTTVSVGDSKTIEFKNRYTAIGGGSGTEDENVMTHEKYIKSNGNGTYDITLNASGSIGSQVNKALVDIVLLVDTSASMTKDNSTKMTDTKNAIRALISNFDAKAATVDTRYKLVKFNSNATIVTKNWVSGSDLTASAGRKQDFLDVNLTTTGGTNYDEGLRNAKTALESSERENAKKVLIFLTDGQPTYYGDAKWNDTDKRYIASGMGSDASVNTLNAALNAAATIRCSDFYAVGIGLPDDVPIYQNDNNTGSYNQNGVWVYNNNTVTERKTGQQILDDVKNKVNATTKDAWNLTNSSQLTQKFTEIAGSTLSFACENVVITDTLSEYVETTSDSKVKVNIATKSGNTFTDVAGNGREFNLSEISDGKSGAVYEGNTKIATVTYNQATKTATLTFESNYKLKENYYYYISITNVTPTKEAFDEYRTSGYPNTGDANTDAADGGYTSKNEGTSSDKGGFYSNATATISYTWKGTTTTENYVKPVVQVETIEVEKRWSGGDSTETILVQLMKGDQPVAGRILKLTSGNDYEGKFIVEHAANYSGVHELKQVDSGTEGAIQYEGKWYVPVGEGEVTTVGGVGYKVNYTTENGKYIITNTKASEKLRIIKTGTDTQLKLEGAEFTLKDKDGNLVKLGNNTTGTYTSDEYGLVLESELQVGTYTLEEVKAPEGYVVLPQAITITVTQDGITVTDPTGKVSIEKKNDGYYEVTVQNEVLYDLPSTGSTGIFTTMMGGILLMMAGILIIFKMRREGVLKR